MKKTMTIMILLTLAVFFGVSVWAEYYHPDHNPIVEEQPKPETPLCPVTKMGEDCMSCHEMVRGDNGKPTFGLKELPLDAGYSEKPGIMTLVEEDGELYAYLKIVQIADSAFRSISHYMYRHPELKRLVVEMHSPGGSVMDAWRSIGIIEEMRQKGIEIETRCYGYAASAGFLLVAAGDKGKRFVNPHSQLMCHKIWTFEMFSLKTPDSAEDQAATLKAFQKNINNFLLERTKITQEKLDAEIYKRDWWMTGAEAVELGIADGFVGGMPYVPAE